MLSLNFVRLGSKSTTFSPAFCVCRPRKYYHISRDLNLISEFVVFFLLIVWADGINKCGWCLAGCRGCWHNSGTRCNRKLNISFFITLPHLLDALICKSNSMSIVLLLKMMLGWDRSRGGWFISGFRLGDKAWVPSCSCWFFLLVLCLLFSHVLYLYFKVSRAWCLFVSLFVYYLFSLSLVAVTKNYWVIEIVMFVM